MANIVQHKVAWMTTLVLACLATIAKANDVSFESGYLDTLQGQQYFYILAGNRSIGAQDCLILWTNGGMGTSSLLGFFAGVGPLKVGLGGEVRSNPDAWTEFCDVLVIDDPAGTGISRSSGNPFSNRLSYN